MAFGPSASIAEFWRDEVLARYDDFQTALVCLYQSQDDIAAARAIRRAVDAASAFAALTDQVAAKIDDRKKLGLGDLKLQVLQMEYARAIEARSTEMILLRTLNKVYKHGEVKTISLIFDQSQDAIPGGMRVSAAPGGHGTDANSEMSYSGPTGPKLEIDWRLNDGFKGTSDIDLVFQSAKGFWRHTEFPYLEIHI